MALTAVGLIVPWAGAFFWKAAWAVREIVVFECHGCGKKVGCGLVLFALHPPCPRCGAAMDAIGRLPYYPSAESWALAGTESGPARARGTTELDGDAEERGATELDGDAEARGAAVLDGDAEERGTTEPDGDAEERGTTEPDGDAEARGAAEPDGDAEARGAAVLDGDAEARGGCGAGRGHGGAGDSDGPRDEFWRGLNG